MLSYISTRILEFELKVSLTRLACLGSIDGLAVTTGALRLTDREGEL